jgi:hypothetical protein
MKIMACATPFDSAYKDYFVKSEKESKRRSSLQNNAEPPGQKII